MISIMIFAITAGIVAAVALRPENRLRLVSGWHTLDIVEQADEVTLYHVPGEGEWQRHIIGKPVIASPNMAHRITAVVADPKSYDWYAGNMCLPSANVIVQFRRGTETVNAYFCLSCHMAAVGEQGRYTIFDPMWNQKVSILKEAFPDDAALRSLRLLQLHSRRGSK